MPIVRASEAQEFLPQAYRLFCSHRSRAWSCDSFKKSCQWPYSFFTVEQENLLAYVLISHLIDEAEIEDLCVTKYALRQGLASNMLTKASEELQQNNVKKLHLEVAVNNIAAITLYEKHDFKHVNTRKNYYLDENGKRIDAFLMTKFLS